MHQKVIEYHLHFAVTHPVRSSNTTREKIQIAFKMD